MSEPRVAVELGPVHKEVRVAAPQDVAFRVFTAEIGSWWPIDRFGMQRDRIQGLVFEGREGGRIYERWADGEGEWGRVVEWDPPNRVLLTWQPTGLPEPTELEVRFVPLSPERTTVHLEHRGWDRWGGEAADERAGYDRGWVEVLARYEERLGSA